MPAKNTFADAPAVSDREAFMAAAATPEAPDMTAAVQGDKAIAETIEKTGDLGVTAGYKNKAPLRKLYRPGRFGWTPRAVVLTDVGKCMDEGDRITCGDCGSNQCSGKPNECPGKANVKFIRCPVPRCGSLGSGNRKIIYDKDAFDRIEEDGPADPNEISLGFDSSPEARLRAALQVHMQWAHPEEATAYGFAPPTISENAKPAPVSLEDAFGQLMGRAG